MGNISANRNERVVACAGNLFRVTVYGGARRASIQHVEYVARGGLLPCHSCCPTTAVGYPIATHVDLRQRWWQARRDPQVRIEHAVRALARTMAARQGARRHADELDHDLARQLPAGLAEEADCLRT